MINKTFNKKLSFSQSNIKRSKRKNEHAFTLLEILLVFSITIAITLCGIGGYKGWTNYKVQATTQAALNVIASAQRSYLLDNPTETYSTLTSAMLSPYIPEDKTPEELMPSGVTVAFTLYPPTATYNGKVFTSSL